MKNAEEIKKEIEVIEHKRFIHSMKDRWSSDDFVLDAERAEQVHQLKEQLKALI